MERNVERLIVAGRAIGHPCNHPLSVIGLREYSQSIKERLERCINTYLEALKGMQFAVLKFAGENSLKNPETYESLNSMVERCVQYEIWYQYPAEWALQDKHSVFEDIEAMAQHFATVIDTKEKLLTIWNEDFLKVPVSEFLTRYNEAVSKWFLPKMLEINKLAKSLMLYSKGAVDRNYIGENLLLLKKYQDELNEANQLLSIYQQVLGNLYLGDDTDWEDIANKAKSANDKLDDLMKVSPDKECIRAIFTNEINPIILDGDSYNAAKTTRDRELAQIAVLNGLGWNIHRIWTMDWYDNQVKELNKLLSLLDELKNTSEKKTTGGSLAVTPKTSAVPIQKNVIEKVVTAEQKKKYSAVVYESVVLSYTPMSADNMLDYHSDEIRKRITQIIQKEGPVCEKFLYKKVVQSFGVTRVGSRIQGRLEVLVGNNRDNVTKQESGKVFWPAGINPDNYYGFRASGENENKRDAKDVPVYEALNAMSYILFNDISVEEEDLIREAAKLMGYARVGTGVSTLFKTALKLGCKNGRLIKEDIRWKLTEEGNIFAKNLGSNVVCEEIVSEELNDELDDIDTTTSKLVAKNIKAKEIAKKCALDKITNCDSNCKFYFTCSHAGD